MSLSRFAGIAIVLAWVGAVAAGTGANASAAQGADQSPEIHPSATRVAANQRPAILPQTFAGWQMSGTAATSSDPAKADPTNAAILKEYGFSDVESATYTADDGRTLKIRSARFEDASGAFGAYTFYLTPEMNSERVGDQGASLGHRVLFYRGHILVDAQFSQESAMSMAQLRELAGALPHPSGTAGNLPEFIKFMPRRGYLANTQKYAMGPQALAAMAPPVSTDLVDFGVSSEVSMGRYSTDSGEATLMLISYPTPQLAADHYRRIEAAYRASRPQSQNQAQPQEGVSAIGNSGAFFYKRTGTIIAIAAGPASARDADSLLGMVNWEANVTWNTPTDNGQARDLYMLMLNIVILCAVLAGLAIVAGVAFGGIRILMKRWFPEKVFDRPEQMEFISLRLTETVVRGTTQSGREGGRQTP